MVVCCLKGGRDEFTGVCHVFFSHFHVGDVLMRKLLLFLLMVAPGISAAAVVATPIVQGYSASAGRFASAAGTFSMTAANDGFIKPAVLNVGGRAVTLPATLRMAANAGQIAKDAMRLNPWLIAGTLAASWLLQNGLDYVNGTWMKSQQNGLPYSYSNPCFAGGVQWSTNKGCYDMTPVSSYGDRAAKQSECVQIGGLFFDQQSSIWYALCYAPAPASVQVPATPQDWDNLPDPLPAIAPELPYAPYLPDGVPVLDPEYAPQDVPLGDPYKMPDNSTVQDMAKITPAGQGNITVVTYNITVNDSQGNPVTNPTPTVTPDPPFDLCQTHPDSVACMTSGGPPTFTPPTDGGAPADPSIVAAGGAIDWHQHFLDESSACGLADVNYSVMNQQFTIPLSSLCLYLPILRAAVIFLATIVSIRMFALAPW